MTIVSIVGGGRWARTIASVICSLPTAPERTILHSRRNEAGIAAWIEEKQLGGRLGVSSAWPEFPSNSDRPDAVIVANQVAEHTLAASAALRAGIPVLIEKPTAITRSAVQQLCDLAKDSCSTLAASNVFLFARYLDAFADTVAAQGKCRSLSLTWTDGQADIRHGEAKSYDTRVSVFDDVLPHVVPVTRRLLQGDFRLMALAVRQGGSEVLIEGRSGDVEISLALARNSDSRRRRIEVETARGPCALDFSSEPGFILAPDSERKNGDPLWSDALRPLGAMLTAFLATVRGGALDERLSPEKALMSAAFADAVREKYLAHQVQWLNQRIGTAPDAPLRYALQEFGLEADWTRIDNAEALRRALAQSISLPAA